MTEHKLVAAIKDATKRAYEDLLRLHPGKYYYFSLITTGEAHSPVVAAWSEEALEEAVKGEDDKDDARWGLKWSYADSPYYCFGEEYFQEAEHLFSKRPDIRQLDGVERTRELSFRFGVMEEAVQALESEGLFGVGDSRNGIVVNVEVMPPDPSNAERAIRLNPPKAIVEWLEEAAET